MIGPTVPCDGPRDVPDLRAWLVEMWTDEDALYVWGSDGYWLSKTLPNAALWWVEPETCDLLAASAPSMPGDFKLDLHEIPMASGLAVFGSDLIGLDAKPKPLQDPAAPPGHMIVSGLLWGPVRHDDGNIGLGIASFSRHDLGDGRPPLFSYTGRSDWIHTWAVDDVIPMAPGIEHQVTRDSMAEDRRLLASLFAIAATPTLATTVEQRAPRPAARRSARKGLASDVRVLTLNSAHTHVSNPGIRTVDWQHSWIVRPHWRWQAHGPGRTLRRLKLIPAHRKGPEDKPLIGGERVWRVVPPKVAE